MPTEQPKPGILALLEQQQEHCSKEEENGLAKANASESEVDCDERQSEGSKQFHGETPKAKLEWAYGVTTVAERLTDLLPQTLDKLARGGFRSPLILIDGPAKIPEYLLAYRITTRGHRIGAYGHWVASAWELYASNPKAARFAIFQDDLTCYRGLLPYLEALPYPERGYQNLYTVPENEKILDRPKLGWYLSNQLGKGALALVFSNEVFRKLLHSEHLVEHSLDAKRGDRAIDGSVVSSLAKAGIQEYVHYPSLVQHTGIVSAIGNTFKSLPSSYRGADFDARDFLDKPAASPGLGDIVGQALSAIGITEERVTAWLGEPCGCPERKRRLNELGDWARRLITGKSQTEQAKKELDDLVK